MQQLRLPLVRQEHLLGHHRGDGLCLSRRHGGARGRHSLTVSSLLKLCCAFVSTENHFYFLFLESDVCSKFVKLSYLFFIFIYLVACLGICVEVRGKPAVSGSFLSCGLHASNSCYQAWQQAHLADEPEKKVMISHFSSP